jgi:hypothetical protein
MNNEQRKRILELLKIQVHRILDNENIEFSIPFEISNESEVIGFGIDILEKHKENEFQIVDILRIEF